MKQKGVGQSANPSRSHLSRDGLLGLDRQVMHIDMTGQAVGEHLQLFFVMRFIMTLRGSSGLCHAPDDR